MILFKKKWIFKFKIKIPIENFFLEDFMLYNKNKEDFKEHLRKRISIGGICCFHNCYTNCPLSIDEKSLFKTEKKCFSTFLLKKLGKQFSEELLYDILNNLESSKFEYIQEEMEI